MSIINHCFELTRLKSLGLQVWHGVCLYYKVMKKSDKLKDMTEPIVLGYKLSHHTLTPVREYVNTTKPGDYGADPLSNGMFKMIPGGDIVDLKERNKRLGHKLGH